MYLLFLGYTIFTITQNKIPNYPLFVTLGILAGNFSARRQHIRSFGGAWSHTERQIFVVYTFTVI